MAVEDECHCSDTSEPSNLTSVHTDMSSIMNYPELNKNGVTLIEKCLCRSVQCPPPDNALTRPVREVSPQRYQADYQAPLQNYPNSELSTQPVVQNRQTPVACHCPYTYKTNGHNVPKQEQDLAQAQQPLKERTNFKWPRRQSPKLGDKTFQVKVKKNQYQNYPKSYVCCEMSEGIPKKQKRDLEKLRAPGHNVEDGSEKIDIYYFDHGNSAYYRTTDAPPILATEKCAERTDYIATRFWAEIFGTIHIGIAFVTAFILQLIRFLLFSIVRPLTVGIVQLIADYFIKPALSILFNALIQPVLILLYNIATSFRDLCEPVAEGIGFFLREIAQLFRAFRIVEVNNSTTKNCS
ncbi:uncharacterized protein LOC105685842 [Athalia rosae]|uniref:uncharacterized protein LOC105685842 n=1 Tax=Athalia rosae TaxID=37344 RepID=UPI00203389F1|nr:uncharacterized protein LOC105685842 [Athalia rosae]